MDIRVIGAQRGDCFWLRWQDTARHNLLIDAGPAIAKTEFLRVLQAIHSHQETVDLLVLTHIDDDHIQGFLRSLSQIADRGLQNLFQKIWFNVGIQCSTGLHSAQAAQALASRLNELHIPYQTDIVRGQSLQIGTVSVQVITPQMEAVQTVMEMTACAQPVMHSSKEVNLKQALARDRFQPDQSTTNKASIGMVLTDERGTRYAFLGDAHAKDIAEGLQMYFPGQAMDLVKLPHHGSARNTSAALLRQLSCDHSILSTSGALDMDTLARMVKAAGEEQTVKHIYCNYEQSQAEQELRRLGIACVKLHKLTEDGFCIKDGEYIVRRG